MLLLDPVMILKIHLKYNWKVNKKMSDYLFIYFLFSALVQFSTDSYTLPKSLTISICPRIEPWWFMSREARKKKRRKRKQEKEEGLI